MKAIKIQEVFLNQAYEQKMLVTLFLSNGFQLKGVILGFDEDNILLDCEGRQNLVYQHSVSAVLPARTLTLSELTAPDAPSSAHGV